MSSIICKWKLENDFLLFQLFAKPNMSWTLYYEFNLFIISSAEQFWTKFVHLISSVVFCILFFVFICNLVCVRQMPIRGWQYCPKPPNQVLDQEQFELSKPTSYQIKVYFNQAIKGKQTKQQSLLNAITSHWQN